MSKRTRKTIEIHATDCAKGLLTQGWTGAPSAYDIGNFFGDRESLENTWGRKLSQEEVLALEEAIREALARETSESDECRSPALCACKACFERSWRAV
jgi:hypothetical protein